MRGCANWAGEPTLDGNVCQWFTVQSSVTSSWRDKSAIDTMLDDYQTWAVVGLGDNPWRSAYSVAQDLQAHGKRIVPIHPAAADGKLTVLGEKAYPTLADVPFPIDVVEVFRRSEAAGEFADQAVQIGAKGVWFQMGVIDEAAFERASDAGLLAVMDACPSREWYVRERSASTPGASR
jgi:predicted CoA-binding protein